MKAQIILLICLNAIVSWPSYKKHQQKQLIAQNSYQPVNTATVHNECCAPDTPINNQFNVEYPPNFVMEWDMFHLENCYQNYSSCPQPPYQSPSRLNYTRKATGVTYYDSSYRGGSQVQIYHSNCIPIFPSYDPPKFSCQFYNINQQNKAFMTTKGAPKQFGQCCILAAPFHPPARNFTSKMLYGGKNDLGKRQYFKYSVMTQEAGPFVHGFWADQTHQSYYTPGFFYMLGINNILLYQQFKNFKVKKFNSKKIFNIPQSCRSQTVKACPDFENSVKLEL